MSQIRIGKRGKTFSYIFETGKKVDDKCKVVEKGGFLTPEKLNELLEKTPYCIPILILYLQTFYTQRTKCTFISPHSRNNADKSTVRFKKIFFCLANHKTFLHLKKFFSSLRLYKIFFLQNLTDKIFFYKCRNFLQKKYFIRANFNVLLAEKFFGGVRLGRERNNFYRGR